jgi:hypothetical protein
MMKKKLRNYLYIHICIYLERDFETERKERESKTLVALIRTIKIYIYI